MWFDYAEGPTKIWQNRILDRSNVRPAKSRRSQNPLPHRRPPRKVITAKSSDANATKYFGGGTSVSPANRAVDRFTAVLPTPIATMPLTFEDLRRVAICRQAHNKAEEQVKPQRQNRRPSHKTDGALKIPCGVWPLATHSMMSPFVSPMIRCRAQIRFE